MIKKKIFLHLSSLNARCELMKHQIMLSDIALASSMIKTKIFLHLSSLNARCELMKHQIMLSDIALVTNDQANGFSCLGKKCFFSL